MKKPEAIALLIIGGAAILRRESPESFLGTQGDLWDTQWDMFLAFIGSVTAQLLLARAHGRQLEQMVVTTISKTEKT